ncbi:hypothetical protein GCM10011371_06600 [Novosphingobium marinum]|uniref:Pyridoxamine 5'-phosphate oxidase N-terminal domain-containing protein n=1 Tax=Novosphingobium marinum TaxID=1514948 RepID=A0A7Y9XWG6_9SPHN|nr:pyridoxamine 5'-phosphate oxidase family protein [Novosphingobium marinum]NYH94348.1 hypothetical protein [Novosphingobium marinum]GGC21638.1 hypothetical protein GCM10011371_06600 [Novosphingobium marinum]
MSENLEAIWTGVLSALARGAIDRRSPMHTPVVSTADADARVMVLRHLDTAEQTARFHTDARAPKVAVIKRDPDIGLLFYDREAKLQIRCRGRARIENEGPSADRAWLESTNFARRCYLGAAPGAVSNAPTSGLPDWAEGIEPSDSQLEAARQNFAVLLVDLIEIDWFSLAHTGHRRAIFVRGEGRWISP